MSRRLPDWTDTVAWRQLLRATVQPEARRRIVRDRALAAGAIEGEDGTLLLPGGLEGEALVSLKAQAGMVGIELRDAAAVTAETVAPARSGRGRSRGWTGDGRPALALFA
jgi:hypothetical protein